MVILLFILLLLFTLFLLYRAGLLKRDLEGASVILLTVLAFLLRYAALDRITGDYCVFLNPWVTFFRDNGGFAGLGQSLGNYNVPYLYFLALFSYTDIYDLHLIKLLSIFFDILLAFYCMKIAVLFTGSRVRHLAVFFGVLFLPTVMINGALWGQCDSIYTALAVMSLYYGMAGKPCRAMAAIAASFAFKLQAVFIMPVFFLFLIKKKIRLRHLPIFPAVYLIMILPAVIAGRPFLDTLLFYVTNATSAGAGLNYNSSSMYAFPFLSGDAAGLAKLGIAAAFLLVAGTYILLTIRRKRVDNNILLCASLLFAIGIPFFLPHMHDRYFFPADVLSLLYAVLNLRRLPIPFLVSWASLLGYHAYLQLSYFLPMWYGSIALLAALIFVAVSMIYPLFCRRQCSSKISEIP